MISTMAGVVCAGAKGESKGLEEPCCWLRRFCGLLVVLRASTVFSGWGCFLRLYLDLCLHVLELVLMICASVVLVLRREE